MNKLLVLALLGFALIALTAGNEEESDSSLQSLQAEVQQSREVREAKKEKSAGKENKSAKNGKKKSAKKGKKNKSAKKGKKNKSAKKGKKNKSAKKGKKNKSAKKGKKNKSAKKGKKNKSAKKGKKNKSAKKGKKNKSAEKGKKNKSAESRQTCASDDACLTAAVTYMKQVKDKAKNFETQALRITKFQKLSGNKGGKKDEFKGVISKLREATGGNASAPVCQGANNGPGATATKAVLDKLLKCEDDIKQKCETDAPKVNTTLIEDCTKAMTTLQTMVDACVAKTNAAEVCACWKDAKLKAASDAISKCDISVASKDVAAFKKGCTDAFAVCRGEQDNANEAVYLCGPSVSPQKILAKLKATGETKAALDGLKAVIDKATAKKADARQTRAVSCTEFAKKVKAIAAKAEENSAAAGLADEIKAITADPPATCTDAEKTALKAAGAAVTKAVDSITAEVAALQASLSTLTGSTASPAAIAAATTAKPVVTSAPGRKSIMRLKQLFN